MTIFELSLETNSASPVPEDIFTFLNLCACLEQVLEVKIYCRAPWLQLKYGLETLAEFPASSTNLLQFISLLQEESICRSCVAIESFPYMRSCPWHLRMENKANVSQRCGGFMAGCSYQDIRDWECDMWLWILFFLWWEKMIYWSCLGYEKMDGC